MNIRRAGADDAPALARVHVDSWRAAYRGLVPDAILEHFTYQRRKERFRQSLAAGAEETYVVQMDHQVVAFLTLGAARDPDLDVTRTGEIWGIYVSPDHWRKGIGRRLVKEAERILKSRAYENAVLWVLEGNQQARRFYEAMGFSLDGETREILWGTPLQAVRHTKSLRPVEQTGHCEQWTKIGD